jgi:hypothetical protein
MLLNLDSKHKLLPTSFCTIRKSQKNLYRVEFELIWNTHIFGLVPSSFHFWIKFKKSFHYCTSGPFLSKSGLLQPNTPMDNFNVAQWYQTLSQCDPWCKMHLHACLHATLETRICKYVMHFTPAIQITNTCSFCMLCVRLSLKGIKGNGMKFAYNKNCKAMMKYTSSWAYQLLSLVFNWWC